MNLRAVYVVLLAVLLSACGQDEQQASDQGADTVFLNGKIYTINETTPWATALAVSGERIVAIGEEKDIKAQIGTTTKVIDLEGRMMMPGINDAHSHLYGGVREKFYCLFSANALPDEVAEALKECVANSNGADFIVGGYWGSSFFINNGIESPIEWLDNVIPDVAVLLIDDTGHNSWANSKAFAEMKITKENPDPPGGKFVKDADGELNGLLYETADSIAQDFFESRWSDDQIEIGLRHSLDLAKGFGLTGFKDAALRPQVLDVLHKMDTTDGLDVYVAGAQFTPYGPRHGQLDYDYYSKRAKELTSKNLNATFIKIFLDGVPTTSRSAAMLAPYQPDPNHPEDDLTKGSIHVAGQQLGYDVAELDKRGFTIKIHAAGDWSLREALDAYEYARNQNGPNDQLHEIAHAGFVSDTDLPRFAKLGIAPDISPYLWFPSPIMDNIISAVGERGNYYWPNKSLLETGAIIVAGSDWPSVSPSVSPWMGIEITVTREHPDGMQDGVYWPEERLDLAETLKIFTLNGAKALKIEKEAGTLEVGKLANLIVLDRNLFEIDKSEISETKVLQTWYRGNRVYNAQ